MRRRVRAAARSHCSGTGITLAFRGGETAEARAMKADYGCLLALGISRIHRSDSLEALMQAFLSVTPTLVDADAFGLYLLDSRLQARAIYAVRVDPGFLTEYEELRMADPCFLHLLRHHRFNHTREVLGVHDWPDPLHRLMSRWGLRHSIEAPLLAGGRLAGTLNIARCDRGYFESISLERARFLCDEMACAFERLARLNQLEQDLARAGAGDDSCRPQRKRVAAGTIEANTASHRKSEPDYIRAVEDWIRAHCAEPLTIKRLATVGGVSERSLLEGFRRYRGMSPKAMLRDLRFKNARDALLAAQPGTVTVADIATACGLYELGHFAVEYKRRYAETPSSTLRCAATPAPRSRPTANLEIFQLLNGAFRSAGAASHLSRRCMVAGG
jgi:AraC-like DNA-binding protein